MIFADTHTHLYLGAFENDREQVVNHAIDRGIKYMFLPNIDSSSVDAMLALCDQFPGHCYPMMGLHPTSVKGNYREELELVKSWHAKKKFIAVGEIGIDLYWDTGNLKEQQEAFREQALLARSLDLPVVIHTRNSFDEVFSIVDDLHGPGLRGVFHCFTGTLEQARKVIGLGFKLGIGGVLTFKNSGLDRVLRDIDLSGIILETDSPFLAPVPFRGKRNESAYTRIIAEKVASLKEVDIEEVASVTTRNALELFRI
jgi:TatD DNase family protein